MYIKIGGGMTDLDTGSWLIGWKGIAKYLNVSWETARKWHREKKMPVYRVVRIVFAKPDDLDQWLKQFFPTDTHNT